MALSKGTLEFRQKEYKGRVYMQASAPAYAEGRNGMENIHPQCVVSIGGKRVAIKFVEHRGETRSGKATVGFFTFTKIEQRTYRKEAW